MEEYRLYTLGEMGHVRGDAFRFRAGSDAEAFRRATDMLADETLELWRGSQYVATLTHNPAAPLSDCIVVARS